MDLILNHMKQCTEMIGQFWSLYNSESLNKEELSSFLRLSVRIADMLQQIKAHANLLENLESGSIMD